MNDDEERLRALLHRAPPELTAVDVADVVSRVSHPRSTRIAAVAAAVVAVVALAVALPLLHGATPERHPGVAPATTPARSPDSTAPVRRDLATLTRRAPCPPPAKAKLATRAQLRTYPAVAALYCTEADRTYPHDGEWAVEIRKASRTGIGVLVHALDQPDGKPTGGACLDYLILAPPLVFVDAHGNYLVPRYPRDRCGQPEAAAVAAVRDHHWRVISVRKVKQQATAAEVAANCGADSKNMLYLDSQFGADPDSGRPVFASRPDAVLRVCVYRVRPAEPDVGTFLRAVRLSARESARLRAALSGAGTARSCPPQPEFADVLDGSGDYVMVELGGCWRVDRGDRAHETLGTADATVVGRLLGVR